MTDNFHTAAIYPDLDCRLEASLTGEALRGLYARLEDEFRPYWLLVGAPEAGRRKVRLRCLPVNKDYFKRMLGDGQVQA